MIKEEDNIKNDNYILQSIHTSYYKTKLHLQWRSQDYEIGVRRWGRVGGAKYKLNHQVFFYSFRIYKYLIIIVHLFIRGKYANGRVGG